MAAKPEIIEPLTRFGKLTFIEELDRVKIKGTTIRTAMVQCDCGKFKTLRLSSLLMGKAFTCASETCSINGKFSKQNPNPYSASSITLNKEKQIALERSELIKKELKELSKLEDMAFKGKISDSFLHSETRKFLNYAQTRR